MDPIVPDTSSWGDPDWGIKVPPRDGRGILLPDCLVGKSGSVPDRAPPNNGLAQRGSVVDPKTPAFDFGIVQKTEVWAENIADLVSDLYSTMHSKRIRELIQVGFDAETAARISELHGSGVRNFM